MFGISADAVGEAMNIGGATRTTVNEFVDALNVILGTSIVPVYGPQRAGDIPHSMADLSKAGRLIGYEPKVSFEHPHDRGNPRFRNDASTRV